MAAKATDHLWTIEDNPELKCALGFVLAEGIYSLPKSATGTLDGLESKTMKITIALLLLFIPNHLSAQANPPTDGGEPPDVQSAVIALREMCIPNMQTPNCRAAQAKALEARLRQNSSDVKVMVEGAANEILVETWQDAFDDPGTRDPSTRRGWEQGLCLYGYKRVVVVSPLSMAKYEFELNCPAATQLPPPTFHGLKLGVTLGSQLNRCRIGKHTHSVEGNWDDLCFRDPMRDTYGVSSQGANAGVMWWVQLLHGLLSTDVESKTNDLIEVLMPAGSRNAGDGTIEAVDLEYDIEQATTILADLKSKYGQQPDCENSPKRTGFGIPVDSLECTWKMPWGSVSFTAPSTKINIMSVSARTTRFDEALAEKQRKESTKRQAEF